MANRGVIGPLVGAGGGAALFLWVHGFTVVDPTRIAWLMRSDWRFQFLGWQFFRQEPWGWPPGLIEGYNRAPVGSSIGLTDSIPLVAFALKPLHAVLPLPFQYLGPWLLLCFALQGLFGAGLVRLWSKSAVHQAAGGTLFVLLPTLLNRTVHPALCAHFLLLWALAIYLDWRPGRPVPRLALFLLAAIAGLVHPYLAVMVLALEGAFIVRLVREGGWRMAAPAADAVALGVVAVLAGWWAAGLFILPSSALAREGMTTFSMNLLGPVSPTRWSALLPEQRIGAGGQGFEGFQYLGAGVLAVVAVTVPLAVWRRNQAGPSHTGPLIAVALLMAVFALSPKVTLGGRVLVDYMMPWMERLSLFRVTGRFFWPAAYALLAVCLGTLVTALRPRIAAVILSCAVALQLVDLQPGIGVRRLQARTSVDTWPNPFVSEHWPPILAHYRHLVLVPPAQCGEAPISFEAAGYLASLHGLSVNAGEQSRWDDEANAAYCEDMQRRIAERQFADDTIYLATGAALPRLLGSGALTCEVIDRMNVCVTPASRARWEVLVSASDVPH